MGWGVFSFLAQGRCKACWLPLTLAALFGGISLACGAQDAPASYSVKGVVLNSLTHQPIARALVEAAGNGVLTDSTGHFELNLPSTASLFVAAAKPGYARDPASMSPVHAGETSAAITLFLTPQSVIAGHIATATGEDAEGTRVIVYRHRARRDQTWWETQGQATADSAGRFRLTNLQAAEYLLVTAPSTDREGGVHANSSTYGYPAVFYPDGAETSANGLISLASGQQTNVELSLSRQPFYPATIKVRNEIGTSPMSVEVHDDTGLGPVYPAEWNAQKRSAQVDLPNGRYYAELRSYGQPELYGRVEFAVGGAPVTGVNATVVPLHPVRVNILKDFTVSSDDAPVRTTLVQTNSDRGNPGMNLTLIAVDGAGGTVGGLAVVKGPSDTILFEIEGVTPGRYWVRTTPNEGYVASVTSGGVDLAREALTIGSGNTTPAIDVTLRNDGGQIHCTLQRPPDPTTPGASSRLVSTYAVPVSPMTGAPLQSSAVNGNETSFSNVAPGTYTVIALDQFADIDNLEPAILTSYLSKGQTVTVEAQGSANVMLEVIQTSGAGAESESTQ